MKKKEKEKKIYIILEVYGYTSFKIKYITDTLTNINYLK